MHAEAFSGDCAVPSALVEHLLDVVSFISGWGGALHVGRTSFSMLLQQGGQAVWLQQAPTAFDEGVLYRVL